jgi:hypothetical protein
MTRRLLFATALLSAIFAGQAQAADITGSWSGTLQMGDNPLALTFTFQQDGENGEKLTGTVSTPQGEPLPLNEGKVVGDKVTFFVTTEMDGNPTKFVTEGTIKGDEITLTIKVGSEVFGGGPVTLKRAK